MDQRPKFCVECGAKLLPQAFRCHACGAASGPTVPGPVVVVAAAPPAPLSRKTAAVLALFLGGVGAHKFYLGRWVQGIVYLIFALTLIPAFIAFVESIALFSMSDATFRAKFG